MVTITEPYPQKARCLKEKGAAGALGRKTGERMKTDGSKRLKAEEKGNNLHNFSTDAYIFLHECEVILIR